jgi:hypothetical protein
MREVSLQVGSAEVSFLLSHLVLLPASVHMAMISKLCTFSRSRILVVLCACIYPEVLSPEADLRPRSSMHIRGDIRSGRPVQYLNNMNNMIHGHNLSSTSGKPEFVAQ